MKTRNEKLNFLKGVMTGKRRVSELLPVKIIVSLSRVTPDGKLEYVTDEKIFSQEEWDKLPGEHIKVTF